MIESFLHDAHGLPALPAALSKLLQLVRDEADVRDIARTINLDSVLTARLLRVANSPFYGFRQQVSTVQHATVLLGTTAVRNLALGVAVAGMRAHMPADGALDAAAFWRHSIAVACAARHLARAAGADPEEAFVAGLLHDIGKLVIMRHEPATYRAVLDAAARGQGLLRDLEQVAFGTDHAAVGGALCRHWGIPGVLTAPVTAHHQAEGPVPLLAVLVGAADEVALLAGIGDSGSPYVEMGRPAFAVHRARLLGLVESLTDEVACLEGLFFDTDFGALEPVLPVADRPRVRVDVDEPERDMLLRITLTALGYVVDEAAPVVVSAEAAAARSGAITAVGFERSCLHVPRLRQGLRRDVLAAVLKAAERA